MSVCQNALIFRLSLIPLRILEFFRNTINKNPYGCKKMKKDVKILSKIKKIRILLLTLFSVILLLDVMFFSVSSVFFYDLPVPSAGPLRTFGVEAYWNLNSTKQITEIKWDEIYINKPNNITIYVKSLSNVKTTLELSFLNNEITDLSKSIRLSWDYYESPLNPGDCIPVTIFLTFELNENLTNYLRNNSALDFNFIISIIAVEA